jgi:hypothetical protein
LNRMAEGLKPIVDIEGASSRPVRRIVLIDG